MKTSEIRNLSNEDLHKELEGSYKEVFNLRMRLATKQLSNYQELRKAKKKIARIKTLLRERELAGAQ